MAYQGIIPGTELEKLINRRGPAWWDSAIRKGSRIALLQFGDKVAGYANYGRNRARSLYYDGEIYELYLRPEFQGLGFGRRLFTAARRDSGAERTEVADRVGAVGKRKRGGILPRARRQGGGTLVGKIRHPRARQSRLRLEQLTSDYRLRVNPPACTPRVAYWRAGRRSSSVRRRPAPA